MDLAHELQNLEPKVCPSPWEGHEHSRGYAVMNLPFSSGHLLGLRVFPENDFAPYHSVWHRNPEGEWSIYNDGPSLRTTCPRWWGPVLRHSELTPIEIAWTGPNELNVKMENPQLNWRMTMRDTPLLRKINAINASMPLWTWRFEPLLRLREWLADKMLDLGELRFSFTTPRGHEAVIIPERFFIIQSSEASWQGQDLGHPTKLRENPTIGDVPLPTRPTFIIGQAHGKIVDMEEYAARRKEFPIKDAG